MVPMLFQLPVDTNLDNPLNQSILTKQVLVYINNKSWIKEIDKKRHLFELFKNELNYKYLFYMIYDSSNDALIKQLYQKLSKYINLTISSSSNVMMGFHQHLK